MLKSKIWTVVERTIVKMALAPRPAMHNIILYNNIQTAIKMAKKDITDMIFQVINHDIDALSSDELNLILHYMKEIDYPKASYYQNLYLVPSSD